MDNFHSLALPPQLMRALDQMKFVTPTPIQAQAIPPALEGRDILGTAQTGTGKTAAFGIPLITKLLGSPRGTALVLTPTRELAVQVQDTLTQLLGKYSPIKTALLIGGESMPAQTQQLRSRPRVLVGTPGRIFDHLERGSLMLHDTSFFVLDESDRMLDMGFAPQIERIAKYLPPQRQTLMFSATLPPEIMKMVERYMSNPVRVSVGSTTSPIARIKQEIVRVSDTEKYERLLGELHQRQGTIIIFVRTKWGAEKLAQKLSRARHSADAIHGDLSQSQRERVITAFREKGHRIMVATDIACRGLDIPHIEHVINYDLPQVAEDYIHRIGRTARAGAEGSAISFIGSRDGDLWRAIEKLIDPTAKPSESSSPRQSHSRGQQNSHSRGKKSSSSSGHRSRNAEKPKSRQPNAKKADRKPSHIAEQPRDSHNHLPAFLTRDPH